MSKNRQISKKFIEEIFDLEKERRNRLNKVVSAFDEPTREAAWAKVRETSSKLKEKFKSFEVDMQDERFAARVLVSDLFTAVGHFGMDNYLKCLEIYDIEVV